MNKQDMASLVIFGSGASALLASDGPMWAWVGLGAAAIATVALGVRQRFGNAG